MNPTEKHRETAQEALTMAITASRAKSADAGIDVIVAALANAERVGMRLGLERAVEIGQAETARLDRLKIEASIISEAIMDEWRELSQAGEA